MRRFFSFGYCNYLGKALFPSHTLSSTFVIILLRFIRETLVASAVYL